MAFGRNKPPDAMSPYRSHRPVAFRAVVGQESVDARDEKPDRLPVILDTGMLLNQVCLVASEWPELAEAAHGRIDYDRVGRLLASV